MTDTTNRYTDTSEARADIRDETMTEDRPTLHTDDLLARDTGSDRSDSDRSNESDDDRTPLFSDPDNYRNRWQAIQVGFVDEPRRAVEDADALVAEVVQQLIDSFAGERKNLEGQWSRGDQVSTEDLRVALRRYRSFFDRLLST